MKINSFEEILAWQKSKLLSVEIYKIFSQSRDFSFRDQIRRASVSIMNNIAEGFERDTTQEFKRFLFISKGSCGEVRSMLYLAKEINYLNDNEFNKLMNLCIEVSKLLSGFIKYLK